MSTIQSLPLAILGDKKSLSKDAQFEIDSLSKRQPAQFLAQLSWRGRSLLCQSS